MGNRIAFVAGILFCTACLSSQAAERIVSLNACTDELLLQLADPKKIAAVTRLQHSAPAEEILKLNPVIRKIPANAEAVLKMNPDLVVAQTFSDKMTLHQLKQARITVKTFAEPKSWAELAALAEEIGDPEKTAALKRDIDALHERKIEKGIRAIFWGPGGHVPGRNTFEDEIIRTLGFENAAGFESYAFMPLEKLIELKPAVILVTQKISSKDSWNYDTVFHPALKQALPELEYVFLPEESISCASPYTAKVLRQIIEAKK